MYTLMCKILRFTHAYRELHGQYPELNNSLHGLQGSVNMRLVKLDGVRAFPQAHCHVGVQHKGFMCTPSVLHRTLKRHIHNG